MAQKEKKLKFTKISNPKNFPCSFNISFYFVGIHILISDAYIITYSLHVNIGTYSCSIYFPTM